MLMLSEAGHKEAAQAEKKAEEKKSRELATQAAKLKDDHRNGKGVGGTDRDGELSGSVVSSVIEGEGVKEEGAFLVHATRGKTRCTIASGPDSTVRDANVFPLTSIGRMTMADPCPAIASLSFSDTHTSHKPQA